MKKIFTTLLIALSTLTLFAQEPLLNKIVKETTASNKVEFIGASGENGVVYFLWKGEAPAYYIRLNAVLDEGKYYSISEGAWYSEVLATNGYYGFSTSLLLEYGYTTGNEYINSDFSLKPGNYLLIVRGIDEDFNTVENPASLQIRISPTATGIHSVSTKLDSRKFIKEGKFYFISGNKVYDALGRLN